MNFDGGHCLDCFEYQGNSSVKLENNVWIGSRAMILKGITIGAGSVVATGAVGAKSVPSNSVGFGVPAKVIRENVHWTKK
jgi:acetyltransferase-like isoleucine patch superfamily enzyme